MDPITTALVGWALPVLADLVKSVGGGLARRWTGLSVDDEIKLMAAQAESLKAVGTLDAVTGTPSQWVVDLRASTRYIATIVMVFAGLFIVALGAYLKSSPIMDAGLSIAAFPTAFLFGERFVLKMANGREAPLPAAAPRAPTPGA